MLVIDSLEKEGTVGHTRNVQLYGKVMVIDDVRSGGVGGDGDDLKVLMAVVEHHQDLTYVCQGGEREKERE